VGKPWIPPYLRRCTNESD